MDLVQLKASVQLVIAKVRACHVAGNGRLSLQELFQGMHAPMEQVPLAALTQRKPLDLTAQEGPVGRFLSDGDALDLPMPEATLRLPARLSGTYHSHQDACHWMFDAEHAPQARRGFLAAPILEISLELTGIRVKVGGVLGPLLSRRVDLP